MTHGSIDICRGPDHLHRDVGRRCTAGSHLDQLPRTGVIQIVGCTRRQLAGALRIRGRYCIPLSIIRILCDHLATGIFQLHQPIPGIINKSVAVLIGGHVTVGIVCRSQETGDRSQFILLVCCSCLCTAVGYVRTPIPLGIQVPALICPATLRATFTTEAKTIFHHGESRDILASGIPASQDPLSQAITNQIFRFHYHHKI